MNTGIINEFYDLIELKKSVKDDLEEFNISSNRFPVRFIFLNSHDELKNVVEMLTDTASKIELSSYLFSENSWFSNSELMKKIKDIKETSVVVPFSEYIRFLDDVNFYEIFSSLAGIENTNIKIYIPLVGLWERFNDVFWDKYYRKDNWAPIWKLKSNSKQICIYQIDGFDFKEEYETNNLRLVSNTKEWFDLWKTDNYDKIISTPKPLSVFFKNSLPDKTFTQEVISTPKEYLSKIFDVNLDVDYNIEDELYWENLLIDISKKNLKNISLKDIFIEKFNINNIANLDLTNYLDYYLTNENTNFQDNEYKYKKWIVKNFFVSYSDKKDTYLAHCFNKTAKLEDVFLIKNIYLEIFNLGDSENFLEERRVLLNYLNQREVTFPENLFEENFNKVSEERFEIQLNYLTNTTSIEKEKIFEILQSNTENFNSIIYKMKKIFPELYYYLDWNFNLDNVPEWIFEYFKEYNKSKVLNLKSEELQILIDKYNGNEESFYNWYYDIKNQNIINQNDYVLWIDALGIEWLPLFRHFLEIYLRNTNKRIKFESIYSVNLPSATEFNKIKCDNKIESLDNYIHSKHYNYPKSLIEEMKIIKNIAKRISQIDSPTVVIYSDHGFSFLCNKKFGNIKKYNFENHSHEGRYLLIEDKEMYSNEDYILTETESDVHENQRYIVTLKHTSLGNVPSHEVHGGATPEEVLVPYIIIENDDSSRITYEISSVKSEINISKENKLPIKIYPKPKNNPIAVFNNEQLKIVKEDGDYVILLNSSLNKGKQKIILKVDGQEEEIEINIKKGGMEEEEYDFG